MKELVAQELHSVNPLIPVQTFLDLFNKSRVWEFSWGIIFAIENEVHIHILKDYRKKVFLRKALREVTKELFEVYPKIITSVLKDKPNALEFDKKIGFKIIKETSEMWYLEMTKEDFNYV
jgi:hypothetical protein